MVYELVVSPRRATDTGGFLMNIVSITHEVSPPAGGESAVDYLRRVLAGSLEPGTQPLRLAITATEGDQWPCEVDVFAGSTGIALAPLGEFRQRGPERTHQFNAVMLVPTGVDCIVGGHAGDATAAARLLASVCDHLIVHPNVVNASDVNEQTENCLYVEGSVIGRLLMGTIALRKVRQNRVLAITEPRTDGDWVIDQVVNSASAARATLGADCPGVVVLPQPLSMRMGCSPSGRAVGEIEGLKGLLDVIARERRNCDAVALATCISPGGDVHDLFARYFRGDGPNPWGGVEAALTHVVSLAFELPCAHSPTLEDLGLRLTDYGQVDPRKAAEAISTSYFFCVLKGLQRAPRIEPAGNGAYDPARLTAEDVSCLVVPDGCIGLPTLAAMEQGIPVVAVRGNTSLMRGDLRKLPFRHDLLWFVDSYLEAAGLLSALKAGIHPATVRRPLSATTIVRE